MKKISRYISVFCHLVMTTATCQKIPVIQSEIKSFLQRLDVVHLQLLIESRHTEDIIASIVAYPAEMEVSPDNLISFLLPSISLPEFSNLFVSVLRLLRFLRTDKPAVMNPPAVSTAFQHEMIIPQLSLPPQPPALTINAMDFPAGSPALLWREIRDLNPRHYSSNQLS